MELTREQLLEAMKTARIARAAMDVPELGGTIYVRGLSGKEADRFDDAFRDRPGRKARFNMRDWRAHRIVRVVVDKDGAPLFNDNDIDVINQVGVGLLDRILAKSAELSGATEQEREDLGNGSASEAASADSASTSLAN